MVKKSYSEKLLDPRWQKKRLEILNRDEFSCRNCGDSKSTLHIHHTYYESYNPWETRDEYLLTLCHDCHSTETKDLKEAEDKLLRNLKRLGLTSWNIQNIAVAFDYAEDYNIVPIKLAGFVLWLFKNPEEFNLSYSRYLEYEKEETEKFVNSLFEDVE